MTASPPTDVAFFGLGAMGSAMAARLLEAGHRVTVWNRTESVAAEFVQRHPSSKRATSPAAAAVHRQVAIAMLADDDASAAVWDGPDGALQALTPGSTVIECSTLSRGRVARLAALCRQHGTRYIDGPVTGLPDAAATGRLTILAGADAGDLARAQPILDALGDRTMHFGPVGTGTAYKLMINLMGAVQIAAAAEGLRVARAAGLDLELVRRAIATSQAAAPQVVRNVERMITGDHEHVTFSGRLRLKDARYGVEAARAVGVDPRFGDVAVELFARLVESGYGDENESKVFDTP